MRLEKGMAVMKEGDKGDFFYVVESGVYDVLKGSTKVHTYRVVGGAHPSFGELALMCAKSHSSVPAATAVWLSRPLCAGTPSRAPRRCSASRRARCGGSTARASARRRSRTRAST